MWQRVMVTTIVAMLALAVALTSVALYWSIVFPRQPFAGPMPELSAVEQRMAELLRTHIAAIAQTPHNVAHYQNLEAAAQYIEATLTQMGFAPVPQVYRVSGQAVRNIEVVVGPPDGAAAGQTFIIGAHYDSPDNSPGANDNGTGVAALIELARSLRDFNHSSTRFRLVFFVNEERPYGKTTDMGSYRHAKRMAEIEEPIAGMIALETIGYFSGEPGSQRFPPPFGLIYPNTGNFIAFVGLPRSRAFLRHALAKFRSEAEFPSIGGVGPGFIPGFDLSDHWAYNEFGFPAFMITDTAPFRNPHYHEINDLPDTVDYESLARVTDGLARTLRRLAG